MTAKHNIRSEYSPAEYHLIRIAAAVAGKSIHTYCHDLVIAQAKKDTQTLSISVPATHLLKGE